MKTLQSLSILFVFLLGLLVPAASALDPLANPPFPTDSVGFVGCSNAEQHVFGYRMASTLDQIAYYDTGGMEINVWGDTTNKKHDIAWSRYDGARPATGFEAAWVLLCIREEHRDSAEADLTEVISQIRSRDPDIGIYVSPMNQYEEGHVCSVLGAGSFEFSQDLANWAYANLGVLTGPTTGPLTASQLRYDGCHPNSAGMQFVGGQMVDWFDNGGWQNTIDEEAPSAPQNLIATTPNGTTVDLSWDASTDNVGVARYVVERDSVEVGLPVTNWYTDSGVDPETTYQYVIYAEDAAGNRSEASASLPVTTPELGDIIVPVLSIDSPVDGATLAGDVLIQVTASDDQDIDNVELLIDGGQIAVLSTAPYDHEWDTTLDSEGVHTISAIATDTSGNTATTEVVVTVDNIADPVGQFSASTYTATVGETITFYDANTDSAVRREFDWGDGGRLRTKDSTAQHSFSSPGEYIVRLSSIDLDTGLRTEYQLTITIN
jgi:chitodextrinase